MRKAAFSLLVATALTLAFAASAHATFHLMKIREVGNANPADYVELQMYSAGQNHVAGHFIQTYDSTGAVRSTVTFPTDVPQGASQSTILVVRDDGPFPVTPDVLASGSNDLVITQDGAVCFMDTIAPPVAIDCASFGAFPGVVGGDPSPMGTPAAALLPATSIARTIAPGCATLLENSDDTNDSATDFALSPTLPRNNATPPTEVRCAGGGGPDTKAPETSITKKPKKRSAKPKVKIAFASNEAGSSFECRLDKGAFKSCDSPFKKRVKVGKHTFEVAATDAAGNVDPSPARVKFRR